MILKAAILKTMKHCRRFWSTKAPFSNFPCCCKSLVPNLSPARKGLEQNLSTSCRIVQVLDWWYAVSCCGVRWGLVKLCFSPKQPAPRWRTWFNTVCVQESMSSSETWVFFSQLSLFVGWFIIFFYFVLFFVFWIYWEVCSSSVVVKKDLLPQKGFVKYLQFSFTIHFNLKAVPPPHTHI